MTARKMSSERLPLTKQAEMANQLPCSDGGTHRFLGAVSDDHADRCTGCDKTAKRIIKAASQC